MSITTELREWWLHRFPVMDEKLYRDFVAITDRIDAEHQKAEDEWKAKNGQSWLHGYVECRAELMDGNEAITASLEDAGWVKLPVDADGVPIHIGELVDEMLPFGGYAAPAPVDTMELSRGASGYGWMVKLDAENRASISPKLLRHHHEPTVEDVLRNVVTLCHNTWKEESPFHFYDVDDVMKSGNIAEYAAKLRLAGENE